MIIRFQNLFFALALFAGLVQNATAAVTFTNTPAAISNTYNGTITLQIGGLTNTETVVVQKYLDANANGVIGGGDLLVQQFNLTDGTNFVIGGVTNYNVPGDLNSTTGAITATLNFQNGDFVQNLIGKYLYKLSSPGGRFTPITNLFSVTNFPYAQKFTGNVVSNSTSTTLSNAVVLLFPPPRPGHNGLGQPLGGTVANNAGSYTIMVPTGTYVPLAFRSNFVANYTTSPVLTLSSNQTITTNLTLTIATANISGQIVDAANNAIVLPGIFMPVSTTNGLIGGSFSNTNGNFTVRVTSGQWGIGSDDSGLIVHGYVGWNNDTNVNSGVAGVTLAYPKANALLYGSVKDNLGNPLVGIDVNANDSNSNLFSADGYTDANGNYFVGVLGGLGSNDPWQMGIGGDSGPTNYIFSQPQFDQNGGTNLAVGLAVLQNFTAILATNTISGNVKDSNGTNIVGLGVSANTTNNGTDYQTGVDTDTNGNYSLNVANGTWNISVNCNGGSDSLSQLGNYACPNNPVTVNIANNNVVTNLVIQICGGIVISTPSPLPVGEVNVSYNQSIQASDCSGNYNWSQSGGTLPGGLNLFPGGPFFVLFGNPTNSGTFNFTVQDNDGGSNTTNQQYSVTISNALQVTTGSLPEGTNGASYSQQLQAINGVPYGGPVPYSWSLSSGSLPANLNLDTNGFLSGTLATNGAFNFTVAAADSLGAVFDQPLSLNIVTTNFPPLAVGTAGGQIIVLWPASAGTNFTLQMATNLAGPWVTASNGVPQISFTFTNTSPAAFFRLH